MDTFFNAINFLLKIFIPKAKEENNQIKTQNESKEGVKKPDIVIKFVDTNEIFVLDGYNGTSKKEVQNKVNSYSNYFDINQKNVLVYMSGVASFN